MMNTKRKKTNVDSLSHNPEDDTFRMLKRPTFREIEKLEEKWESSDDERPFDVFLLDHYWTYKEYWDTYECEYGHRG